MTEVKKENTYEIGQAVYLITDPEQHERLITSIIITQNTKLYELSFSTEVSRHYEFELADSKRIF